MAIIHWRLFTVPFWFAVHPCTNPLISRRAYWWCCTLVTLYTNEGFFVNDICLSRKLWMSHNRSLNQKDRSAGCVVWYSMPPVVESKTSYVVFYHATILLKFPKPHRKIPRKWSYRHSKIDSFPLRSPLSTPNRKYWKCPIKNSK